MELSGIPTHTGGKYFKADVHSSSIVLFLFLTQTIEFQMEKNAVQLLV